jgi:hypothetical protein
MTGVKFLWRTLLIMCLYTFPSYDKNGSSFRNFVFFRNTWRPTKSRNSVTTRKRFYVFTEEKFHIELFWIMTSCSLRWPPLWSSGQSSWLQILRSGFDSRRYQIFREVVGLERGPLSLMMIIEELLEWKSSGSGQENRINDRGDPLRWPRDTHYPQKLALPSPTSGGRSVGIVRLRTKGHGV